MNYVAKSLMTAFLIFVGATSAHAQNNLEYPGGPHAGLTDQEVERLTSWARNAQLEISRLESEIATSSDESANKKVLLTKLKRIAGETGLRPGDLLLRQSLYAGIVLSDIIDQEALRKGPTAGEVYQQVKILKQAMTMAKKYYISDQQYVNGLLQRRADVQFNNKLIEFGMELSEFIIEQSKAMLPLDASASYGMMRWALGVLNVKLLEDVRNTAFASTIMYLSDELALYPDMALLESDVVAIANIRKLKTLAAQVFSEIRETQKSISN